jgi:hypothetical protein
MEIGIGAGAGVVAIVLIVTAIFGYCWRRVPSPTVDVEDLGDFIGELSGNSLDEVPQLETREREVELLN